MSESEGASGCSGIMGLELNDRFWTEGVRINGINIYLIFDEF